MVKRFALLAVFPFLIIPVFAQTPSDAEEYSFTVSTTQGWTDTGLDLQAGDVLQISAESVSSSSVPDRHAISGSTACDPKGGSGDGSSGTDLPLPSAPSGALIARLHAQGASPILIGAGNQLTVGETSHLFLGANVSGTAPCQGGFSVKVHKVSAQAASGATTANLTHQAASTTPSQSGPGEDQSKSRGEQLKSQLSTAAQIFMAGQFGTGKTEAGAPSASNATSSGATPEASSASPVLKVSESPLDAELRRDIDGLPRRVNDQFKNLGDMANFVIIGDEKDVQSALTAANWHVADTDTKKAVLSAVLETYEKKDYLQMPMSTLYLFDRPQDFGYEQAEPIAMVASRHHFRIWKAPFTWKGKTVWVGAGTHDIGFAKDKRNGNVTHKIDPAVDGERDNIGASIQKAGKAKTLNYYLPPNPIQEAKNATGDGYHSDGRLLIIFLQ